MGFQFASEFEEKHFAAFFRKCRFVALETCENSNLAFVPERGVWLSASLHAL